MKRALFLVVGLLVALSPIQVDAQLYGGPVSSGDQAYLEFVSGSGVGSSYGVQVGPYVGNFADDGFGNFSIYCVDYLHYAKSAKVDVSGMSGSLANTRLGGESDALVRYQKAAYLSSLFATVDESYWGGLHAAIWYVTSGVEKGDAALRTRALNAAEEHYASVNLDEWFVLTAVGHVDGFLESGDGYGQEFLMRRAVPEPGTILLMLTGFVMLIGVSRKRILAFEDL